MDYTLTNDQRRRWKSFLEAELHTSQVELAKKLVRHAKKKKGLGTWKVDLSAFVNGDAMRLRRVLEDESAAAIVAEALGLPDAAALRAEHQRIRGIAPAGAFDVRVPGFEDLGPVAALDVYVPPAASCQAHESFPEVIPPTLEALGLACAPRELPTHLAIVGGSGHGKSTLTKALAALLQAGDRAVRWGDRGTNLDAGVMIVDDWDQLSEVTRRDHLQWLAPGRVLVTAARGLPRGLDPRPGAVLTLEALRTADALAYVAQLADLSERKWGLHIPLEPIRRWLEDDLFAYRLADNHRSLGVVLRHFSADPDGGLPKTGARLLARQLSLQARASGAELEADFFDTAGEHLLERLAARLVAQPHPAVPVGAVVQDLAEVAHSLGAEPSLDDAGVFKPARALWSRAPFRRDEDNVWCDAVPMLMGGLRDRWRDLLPEVAIHHHGQEVLVAAAERSGDAVLTAMLDAEPAMLCQMMPALTRVLDAPATFSDASRWWGAFRMCAVWWAHAPNRVGPANGRPTADRFGCLSPLVVLAHAGVRHRRLLPLEVEPLQSTDLTPELRTWLDIFEIATPSEGALRHVLRFVAPICEPTFPALGELVSVRSSRSMPGLTPHDWDVWWRVCAVPLWQSADGGDRFIAGTAPEASITPGAALAGSGLQVWMDALQRCVGAGDPGALDAIAEAVVLGLTDGGGPLRRVLVQAVPNWVRLRSSISEGLAGALAALEPRTGWCDPTHWADGPALCLVVLRDLLDLEGREHLWGSWHSSDHLPWEAFVEVGVPPDRVANWVVDPLPDDPLGVERQRTAEHLLANGSVESWIRLYQAPVPPDLIRRLEGVLSEVPSKTAVEQRIRASLEADTLKREVLIGRVEPAPDHRDLWWRVVEQSEFPPQRLARIAQWCGAQSSSDRWRPLLDALFEQEDEWSRERGDAVLGWSFALGTWLSHYVGRDDLSGPEDRHELVSYLLRSNLWSRLLFDEPRLWTLAAKILPTDDVVDLMRRGRDDEARAKRLLTHLGATRLPLLLGLLADEDLAPAAARALRQLRFLDVSRPLEILQERVGAGGLRHDAVLPHLVEWAAEHCPQETVAWLEEQLANADAATAHPWWRSVAAVVPAGEARTLATRKCFATLGLAAGSS